MQLWVNGETLEATEAINLTGLLAFLGIEAGKVAVERNREIVPRSRYRETILAAGDRIEIVQFVGGG